MGARRLQPNRIIAFIEEKQTTDKVEVDCINPTFFQKMTYSARLRISSFPAES